jgi:hypothetical protein
MGDTSAKGVRRSSSASPPYGENHVSERGGPHDRIGLPAAAPADERFGDI